MYILAMAQIERHGRLPTGGVCSHSSPRSVGFGPTDSWASGAFIIAPSTSGDITRCGTSGSTRCQNASVTTRGWTRQFAPVPRSLRLGTGVSLFTDTF